MTPAPINNRVTEMTGTDYPIIQAPMGWIARAQLAAAVSNAGGLGIIETSSGELDAILGPLDPDDEMRVPITVVSVKLSTMVSPTTNTVISATRSIKSRIRSRPPSRRMMSRYCCRIGS